MTIMEQFQKLGVADIARRLEIHPFDVVRILVYNNVVRPSWRFDESDLNDIRKLGGIETWWTQECALDQDTIRARGILRSIIRELTARKHVGTSATRVDNVFRGLEPEDEILARKALNLLIQEQIVKSTPTAIGTFVSLNPEKAEVVEAILGGQDMPAALAALWLM